MKIAPATLLGGTVLATGLAAALAIGAGAALAQPAAAQASPAQPASPPAAAAPAPGGPGGGMMMGRPGMQPMHGPGYGPGRAGGGGGPVLMFRLVDANADGRVTLEEAWGFMQGRFAAADRNQDGALVLEEAQAMRPPIPRPEGAGPGGAEPSPVRARMVAFVFRIIDVNRDGRVTPEELRPALEAHFRGMDANGDNGVTLDELPMPPHGGGPRGGPHHHHGGAAMPQGGGGPGQGR